MKPFSRAPFLPFLLLALAVNAFTAAPAQAEAHEWLLKMDRAARTVNYEGVFVYHHGDMLETMRILHRVDGGEVRERLFSLNGVEREIIRTENEVQCYLPDENSVVVEHRRADNKSFPSVLPQKLSTLDANYVIEPGKPGRVAGRQSQLVVVRPKDAYRYGYELWADEATGLLLRADLVDTGGGIIEQFMFTQIQPRASIPDAALKPRYSNKNFVWHQTEDGDEAGRQKWGATRVPPGFALSMRVTRTEPLKQKPIEHLVYSDGLAAVSVFIERLEQDAPPVTKGPNQMGAVHAYVNVVDDHQITVVGEVPAATVNMIGQSVEPLQ